ncbi:amino acid ABC transporter permease [Flaviflexus massiliensis]|uniref:amino acid ABC transporter permease n=1 Tax=Flaviflexus massiliensis TaxID=1522309 RepID=UPI0006D59072|nr:amino acid ABC transporter permease [Flaviflexus massiliensis]
MKGFDPAYMVSAIPALLEFLPTTLLIAIFAMVLSVGVGLVLALIRFAQTPVFNHVAILYISFFRGIPGLVLLFLIYFGLPQLIPGMSSMSAMMAAVVGLGLKEASYLAEIFRAALISVDRGQREAGLSLGLTAKQIYSNYVLPQAAYNAIPGTANVFIGLIKETSIVFTLGITDMFASAQMTAADNLRYLETYLMVGVVYWAVIFLIEQLVRVLESRMSRPYVR